MERIEWTDTWTLDHAEIDEQHKTLISILNKLISRESTASKLLNELIEYAAVHFADEENFMVNAEYPEFVPHRKEHRDFTKTLLDMSFQIMTLNGGSQEEVEQLIEILEKFVSVWFESHFLETDKDFIDYLQGGGK
jgi:hemerythrin